MFAQIIESSLFYNYNAIGIAKRNQQPLKQATESPTSAAASDHLSSSEALSIKKNPNSKLRVHQGQKRKRAMCA